MRLLGSSWEALEGSWEMKLRPGTLLGGSWEARGRLLGSSSSTRLLRRSRWLDSWLTGLLDLLTGWTPGWLDSWQAGLQADWTPGWLDSWLAGLLADWTPG